MNKIVMGFVAALVIGGGVGTAVAGAKYGPYPVTIGSGYAYGSLADARANGTSSDDEYIGCVIAGGAYGTAAWCYAVDSTGAFKMCSVPTASVPTMLPALESIGSQSYVYFSFDGSGNCTDVQTSNLSYISPMVP